MTICGLCFDFLSSLDALAIDHCRQNSKSGSAILDLHFPFSDKIVGVSRHVCTSCWSQLSSFHQFYAKVAQNHEVPSASGLLESEPVRETQTAAVTVKIEKDLDSSILIDFDCDRIESFGTIKVEPLEVIRESPRKRKTAAQPSETRESEKKTAQALKNAEDDEKIRETVDMRCDLCSAPLSTFAETNRHFKRAHKGTKGYLVCCGKKYTKKSRLTEHLNSHFNVTFACEICGKTFFTKTILSKHKVCHLEERLYQCDRCPKCFATKFQVRNHLLNVHFKEHKELTFECRQAGCDKRFSSKTRLDHHTKYTHAGGDKMVCEVCSRTFSRRGYLDEHMRTHRRSKDLKADRHECHVCGHFITGGRQFTRHLKNHETEACDNTCPHCGRQTKSLKTLKKHIYFMHTLQAKHQCKYCSKCFKRPRDLMDHEAAIHTQEDIYTCDFCPRTFRNYPNMTAHRKRDHPDQYQPPSYMRADV